MIEQMGQTTLVLLLSALAIGVIVPAVPASGRGRSARRVRTWTIGTGLALGLLASLLLTLVNTLAPKAVNRQTVALWSLPLAIGLAIGVAVLILLRARRPEGAPLLDRSLRPLIAAYIALVLFRSAPSAMAQAVMLVPAGSGTPSTQTVLAFTGYVLGWAAAALLGALAWKLTSLAQRRWPMVLVPAVLALTHALLIIRILQAQRVIEMSNSAFKALSWFINHEAVFPLAGMCVLLVLAALTWAEGRTMPGSGANPAEGRLNRARARLWKTIAGAAAGGYLCGALLITLGVAVGSAEVELSEPESYSVVEEQAVIDVAKISDGHLHRFAYTTKSGVEVRFIVIQKAGSSFGVGLDACEICGPSGYYEKDGKIICKLCEVAMNIATIGFKGGCNPIPIEYTVSNGSLTVPLSVLEASEGVFA
ncbi:MAG: DUF2318 domain-containing protein [Schaalia hyovaginalis]|uniref:DUF2318 domain-containing protein n=1 Tax=Schaalia hyovaginalis TaxID=29316 RepID=UPI002A91DAE6|nr:DUF2318 domain-containing protein [Schaalia hyovaginalis]MDY6213996.1 DUF2318 domain-containing protein [Schaalia hyovaginalis]